MPKNISFKVVNDKYYLNIHTDASMEEVYAETKNLIDYLLQETRNIGETEITIRTGNRILTENEIERLRSIIEEKDVWHIKTVESNVITKDDAIEWSKKVNTRVEFKTIESGEFFEAEGDILLVGDIEPGGFIRATGNIYILGQLYGVADAGYEGNENAVIVGYFQNNAEIRINKIEYSIKYSFEEQSDKPLAYYLNERALIDTVEVDKISKIRPEIDQVISSLK